MKTAYKTMLAQKQCQQTNYARWQYKLGFTMVKHQNVSKKAIVDVKYMAFLLKKNATNATVTMTSFLVP